jgi:hypothetical protein
VAKSEVQDDLRAHVAAHPEAPHEVFDFLAQHWIKYLVVVRARDGAASEGWKAAAEATEKLLWSVEPKPTIDDHRALTKAIPPLLKSLRVGIAAGGIEEPVASAFFQQLMQCHTAALRAATLAPPAKGKDAKPASRAGQPEFEFDFTRPVELDNPFGAGKVQVNDGDLDFTGEASAAPAVPAAANAVEPGKKAAMPKTQVARLPSKLVVGAWVTVEDAVSRHARPSRLHYVSPRKSHYLFVDRQGNKVFECSRTMLARRIKLGEVVMLDGEPDASLFDRILETLFGKAKKGAGQGAPAGALAPA